MNDKEKLIELFEAIPHAKRLYPDLFVDYLIENGVRIVPHVVAARGNNKVFTSFNNFFEEYMGIK